MLYSLMLMPYLECQAGTASGINSGKDITATRYSKRCEGKSAGCKGDLTAKDFVIDTEQLLKKLGIVKLFIYVSHSDGSKVSRECTMRNPAMISAMLFVEPNNPRDVEIIDPKIGVMV